MLTTWIVIGIILMVLELIVPGMVLVFLGAGALVVAALIWAGPIQTWVVATTVWFIASLIMLVTLRHLFQRFVSGDVEEQSTDEDLDAFGHVVEVVEEIAPGKEGRIRFRGSTWPAACYDATLEVGSSAKIIYRENLMWVVEPTALETKGEDTC